MKGQLIEIIDKNIKNVSIVKRSNYSNSDKFLG